MSAQLTWRDTETTPRPLLTLGDFWVAVLQPLASLKLTVVLFALAIFIIFAGTLAQVNLDIWDVIRIYFRAPIAWIDPAIFFPPTFFSPAMRPTFPAGFAIPFPGGWLIGALMALNLVAAHLTRFQVQARGMRLVSGVLVIAVGMLLTWLVIQYGDNKNGVQQEPLISYATLWNFSLIAMAVGWFCMIAGVLTAWKNGRSTIWAWLAGVVALGGLLGWLLWMGSAAQLDDSSMRILWQLSKGSFAGIVLLIGCGLVFGKRAGIVLLHGGVGLMMFGELLVGLGAVEGQMPITEGQTANFVHDIRTWEVAIIDPAGDKEDHVTVIPKGAIEAALQSQQPIDHPDLPFKIEVLKVIPNGMPRPILPDDKKLATKGMGVNYAVDPEKQVAGTDSSGKIDQTAAYLKLTSKDGQDLGTYLVGITFSMLNFQDDISVGDKLYRMALRFKRTYKPYSITLKDVRKDDYIGTNTPKNYSSDVVINDPSRNVSDRDVKIWMNNPLRFAGETFYQSNYFKDQSGEETTTLAVVSNTGWMIPYVSCMIVAIGMLTHFSLTLSRFLQRSAREHAGGSVVIESSDPRRRAAKRVETPHVEPKLGWPGWVIPGLIVALAAFGVARQCRSPIPKTGEFDLYRFGQLPVVADGRSKPIDTLSRHTLLAISGKSTWKDANEVRQPAVKWFLDMMATPRAGAEHEIIRIENLEVQELLGLERREGFRYGLSEVFERFTKFMDEAERASKVPADQQSAYQRKLLELKRKLDVFDVIFYSFLQPPIQGEGEELVASLKNQIQRQQMLKDRHPPFAVPPLAENEEWQTYASGWLKNLITSQLSNQPPNPFTDGWEQVFNAYARGMTPVEGETSSDREKRRLDAAKEFNSEVAKLHSLFAEQTPKEVNLQRVAFESFFNRTQPMTLAIILYATAFSISAISWLCLAFHWPSVFRILGRTAFSLTVLTLVVHTLALAARMYISGRPPVTNLYSSAVFIGWGCVVLGLILDAVFRIGLGNVVATVAGFSTLLIAWGLESDGSDTFSVMQAVLDTQFWLATHVTCITFGYATTYLAGLFGLLYIVIGVLTPWLNPQVARDLTKMNYGTLCFSIFFSFVGTVLGGLWADDSWGRFWGWDPKENGALMIVLWNALTLHARWGGMVKERGLAVLSVAGNIVVSWSWFGVNALSVGLHSYGFDSKIFTLFCILTLAHLPLIALGLVPRNSWWSGRESNGTLAG